MFPSFHPPQNETAFNTLLASLKNLRQASLDMPINFPSPLRLLRECRNPEPPAGSEPSHAETCTIPSGFRPVARPRLMQECYPLIDMTLIVTEPILTGVHRFSQTYRGCIERSGYESFNVVVKLFQQSFLRFPCKGNFFDELSKSDWVLATELAQREAWAYGKTVKLQGTTVPHSYGFYVFTIPSGEEGFGHVMEEIGGLETKVYLQKNLNDPDAVWALGDAIAWALHAIHCAGVMHSDMSHRNMHIIAGVGPGRSTSLSVVLFDFAFASQIINKCGRSILQRDCVDLDKELISAGAPAEVVGVWRNTRATELPPEWKSMIPYTWEFCARDAS